MKSPDGVLSLRLFKACVIRMVYGLSGESVAINLSGTRLTTGLSMASPAAKNEPLSAAKRGMKLDLIILTAETCNTEAGPVMVFLDG